MAEPFSYAIHQLVPDIERGDRINVGVVVFCRPLDFLGARTELGAARALSLAPELDVATARRHLEAIELIARADPAANTIIQPSDVHTGVCVDPTSCLAHLFERLVA